jgi:exosortase
MRREADSPVAVVPPGHTVGGRPRLRYSPPQTAQSPPPAGAAAPRSFPWPLLAALSAAGLSAYALFASELAGLAARWQTDAGWSHGFVVPLISAYFVRQRWDGLRRLTPRGAWAGLLVLAGGVAAHVAGRAAGLPLASVLAMLAALAGGVLFVLGGAILRRLAAPIVYLLFAVPPPAALYARLTAPMQLAAAEVGAWLLPLAGADAVRRGTVLDVAAAGRTVTLNVEQACSGMRLLAAFTALAAALAWSSPRPLWQKAALTAASVPIAVLCNAGRVALTGALAVHVGPEWARGAAHEYLGLLMLAPAALLQLGTAWVLDRLVVDDAPAEGAA